MYSPFFQRSLSISRQVKLCNIHSTFPRRSFRYVLPVLLHDAPLNFFLTLCYAQRSTVKFSPISHDTDHVPVLLQKLRLYVPLGCVKAKHFVMLVTCTVYYVYMHYNKKTKLFPCQINVIPPFDMCYSVVCFHFAFLHFTALFFKFPTINRIILCCLPQCVFKSITA